MFRVYSGYFVSLLLMVFVAYSVCRSLPGRCCIVFAPEFGTYITFDVAHAVITLYFVISVHVILIWYRLPAVLVQENNLSVFKSMLRTFDFSYTLLGKLLFISRVLCILLFILFFFGRT